MTKKRICIYGVLFALGLGGLATAASPVKWDILDQTYGNGAGQVSFTNTWQGIGQNNPAYRLAAETLHDGFAETFSGEAQPVVAVGIVGLMPSNDWTMEFIVAVVPTFACSNTHIGVAFTDNQHPKYNGWLQINGIGDNNFSKGSLSDFNLRPGDRNLAPSGFDPAQPHVYRIVMSNRVASVYLDNNSNPIGVLKNGRVGAAADGKVVELSYYGTGTKLVDWFSFKIATGAFPSSAKDATPIPVLPRSHRGELRKTGGAKYLASPPPSHDIKKARLLRAVTLNVNAESAADAHLIITPSGKTMLIDAGWPAPAAGANIILPFLKREGIRRLDWMMASHFHDDHFGGMPEILHSGAVTVGQVLWSPLPLDKMQKLEPSEAQVSERIRQQIQEACAGRNVPIREVERGGVVDLGDGVKCHILAVAEPDLETPNYINNNNIVMRLAYGNFSAMFTGDAGFQQEERIMARYQDLTVTF